MFAWGAGKHMQLGTKTAKDEFQPVLVPDAAQYFSKDRHGYLFLCAVCL